MKFNPFHFNPFRRKSKKKGLLGELNSLMDERARLYVGILSRFEEFERQGLLCCAPMHHRVTVSHQLTALFCTDASRLTDFMRGVALYGIYQFTRLVSSQAMAEAELSAIHRRKEELGRDLTPDEASTVRMQVYANSHFGNIINPAIGFDIVIVRPDQEPLVVSHIKDGKFDVLYVREDEPSEPAS